MIVKVFNKKPQKYAINQVKQCKAEPQNKESTTIVATLFSKAPAGSLTWYKITANFSEITLLTIFKKPEKQTGSWIFLSQQYWTTFTYYPRKL